MIREVTLKDLDEVAALEIACFPSLEAASREVLQERIQMFPSSFLVMEKDRKLIAMINGCVSNYDTICDELYDHADAHDCQGAYQSVFGLDVHPAYRHQGYARDMMLAFMELAKNQHRKGMILTCKEYLISFYESFGYQNMGISKSVHGGVIWYDMRLIF